VHGDMAYVTWQIMTERVTWQLTFDPYSVVQYFF
jgi:hypothetical protein